MDKVTEHEGKKYLRTIRSAVDPERTVEVDVYEVLDAFHVTCPRIAHAVKKLLCAGQRGKGGLLDDLIGAKAAVNRAIDRVKAEICDGLAEADRKVQEAQENPEQWWKWDVNLHSYVKVGGPPNAPPPSNLIRRMAEVEWLKREQMKQQQAEAEAIVDSVRKLIAESNTSGPAPVIDPKHGVDTTHMGSKAEAAQQKPKTDHLVKPDKYPSDIS